jgi:ABC-type sugar transport system ATPase subunit
MNAPDDMPLLVAHGVSKSFGAVQALVEVDFAVDSGEVVALVGDNGAGKSTLIKAIAGVQPADRGEYWFDGRNVSIRGPQDASRLGIATVYQDLALCDNLDVVANLFLGRSGSAGRSGSSGSSTSPRWSTAPRSCSPRSASRPSTASAASPARSPAASASPWRSRGRWSASPGC